MDCRNRFVYIAVIKVIKYKVLNLIIKILIMFYVFKKYKI